MYDVSMHAPAHANQTSALNLGNILVKAFLSILHGYGCSHACKLIWRQDCNVVPVCNRLQDWATGCCQACELGCM